MEEKELIEKINRFPRWHYQFNLKGHLTPIADKTRVSHHLQRKKYFFDPLVNLLGGALTGKRVLDLGCNAGFWSLLALDNGCEFVLGIDGRQMHIDQANFVFEIKQIKKDRYKFIKSNIFDLDFKEFGTFDIVFCLGLMYHINKPISLMEKIVEVNRDILLIDTRVSPAPDSHLQIQYERLDDYRNAVDYNLVLVPTKRAIFDIVQQFGYAIIMLRPYFQNYPGANGYRQGTRRAFLCAKETDLSKFPGEIEPLDLQPPFTIRRTWSKVLRYFFKELKGP